MVNFKEDERLSTLNHSCAHVMAQAVKHLDSIMISISVTMWSMMK